ncbi:MAG: response regulator [Candidatus Saccharimonadales bacterium]
MNQIIKKILVVEDDRFIGEMYVRSLRKEGYDVEWVVSGDEGIKAALSNTYDLILLDIMLPNTQGTEVLDTLRTDETDRIPNSRIIILTNFEQDDDLRLHMQERVDGYLIKADITPRKLLEIIKQL